MHVLEHVSHSLDLYENNKQEILETYPFILPELFELQSIESGDGFLIQYGRISDEFSIRDSARILGMCKRESIVDFGLSYLEAMKLFCLIESKIRFSIWPQGIKAPHHFSKLLNNNRTSEIMDKTMIKCILSIVADPKGLNLRNIATHGFSTCSRLSLPLLKGIKELIEPVLPEYNPPQFDFIEEISLFKFHEPKLGLPDSLIGYEGAKTTRFPLLDEQRDCVLKMAYDLYNSDDYICALLLLFPIFEHSLRRAAVCQMKLDNERLCASSEEHFYSVKECCEALPPFMSNMINDLLFHPDGPRIRDRLMHGGITSIPKEFAFCIFVLFERCCLYYDDPTLCFQWGFAFHPVRVLEYKLYMCCGIDNIDLLPIYNSRFFIRLTECLISGYEAKDLTFKDPTINAFIRGPFQKLLSTCVIMFIPQDPKESSITHLLGLASAPSKYASLGDSERLKLTLIERLTMIQKYLIFVEKGKKLGFEDIYEMFTGGEILGESRLFLTRYLSKEGI